MVVLLADHVVPVVKPRDLSTTAAAAAGGGGDSKVASQGEDVLDVIDRLSQTTSDVRRQFDVSDDIFPLWTTFCTRTVSYRFSAVETIRLSPIEIHIRTD